MGLHDITEDISMAGQPEAIEVLPYQTFEESDFGVTVTKDVLFNTTCNRRHGMMELAIQYGHLT